MQQFHAVYIEGKYKVRFSSFYTQLRIIKNVDFDNLIQDGMKLHPFRIKFSILWQSKYHRCLNIGCKGARVNYAFTKILSEQKPSDKLYHGSFCALKTIKYHPINP